MQVSTQLVNFGKIILKKIYPSGSIRTLSISNKHFREVVDRKLMLKSLPAEDEGNLGEKSLNIDALLQKKFNQFPDSQSLNKFFDGIPYKNLPIFNIRVTKNNTIITYCTAEGKVKLTRSCGVEGFKNTRKGTNVAAQATAITIGTKAKEIGADLVRVRVRGLGPGRLSSVKGLQMSGLNIVSVTDNTRVSPNPPRPRKQRKL